MIAPAPPKPDEDGPAVRCPIVFLCCAAPHQIAPFDLSSGLSITRHTPAARARGQRTVLGMPPHTPAIVSARVWRKRDVREAGSQLPLGMAKLQHTSTQWNPRSPSGERGHFVVDGCERYATRTTALSYALAPRSPPSKMPCSRIHSRDSSNTSREYGSNTMRSPGPQRRVSMRSWKRTGNSFL